MQVAEGGGEREGGENKPLNAGAAAASVTC